MATAKSTLNLLKTMPVDQAILLSSPHGMGKSSVIKQAAQALGIEFYDVRLSQCEVGDIKGLPVTIAETKTTEFYKPKWWPKDPKSAGFLFFDEINRANREVRQAVFEIILDRRLDGEYLPDGWRVVSAINGDDRYEVSELDHALFDRFFNVEFNPEVGEWLDWAAESGVHNAIRQFIGSASEYLDPPKDLRQGVVYPSRRSWEKFSRAMTHMGLWESKDPGRITELALGWVGRAAGIRFTEYFLKDFRLVSGEDILNRFDQVKDDLEKMKGDPSAIATISRDFGRYLASIEVELTEEQLNNYKKALYFFPREVASSVWMEAGRATCIRKHIVKLRENDQDFVNYITRLYVSKAVK